MLPGAQGNNTNMIPCFHDNPLPNPLYRGPWKTKKPPGVIRTSFPQRWSTTLWILICLPKAGMALPVHYRDFTDTDGHYREIDPLETSALFAVFSLCGIMLMMWGHAAKRNNKGRRMFGSAMLFCNFVFLQLIFLVELSPIIQIQ